MSPDFSMKMASIKNVFWVSGHGGDPLLQDANGLTALHHSCTSTSKMGADCAKILLSKDASSSKLVDKNEKTAFQLLQSMTDDWKLLIESNK